MADLNDTVMAAFYDLYEDGTNDVITVQTVGEEGRAGHRVGAFTNATQDSDAYFAKIIVLSGESASGQWRVMLHTWNILEVEREGEA